MENKQIEELNKKMTDLSVIVDTLKKQLEDKDKEISELKNTITDKDKTIKEASDKAAVEAVENDVQAGKFKADQREELIKVAKNDLSAYKKISDAIPASTANRLTNVAGSGEPKEKTNQAGRETWTIRDWEKKDPKGLAKIKNESPEAYQEMYESFYKK